MKVCPTCGIEYPASERFCPSDGTSLRALDSTGDLIGSVIADRYHVLRKLGEGGMGQVYLAEHVRMRRKSAVKVMHPSMVNDADAIARFNREAANACQVVHPNVVAIYDFGETSDGVVYLAMEYVEGESLSRLIRTHGSLEAPRAAAITRQIAEGLASAHALGIVHRDLKPDNIIVGRNPDGSDRIKVADFGISKAAQQEGQSVTRSGQVIGTPEYMSPEQLSGDQVDARSDVYSLAIVAFNMLTGRLPFPGDSAQQSMISRLTEHPKRLQETRPDVTWPLPIQQVMDRGLARDASLRYQTATAFGDALMAAVEQFPVVPSGGLATMVVDRPGNLGQPGPSVPGGASGTTSAPSASRSASQPTATPSASVGTITPVGPQHLPPGSSVTPANLQVIESCLVKVMGPIASVLVKRAARVALSADSLVDTLAGEIDDETDRAGFRASCRRLLR